MSDWRARHSEGFARRCAPSRIRGLHCSLPGSLHESPIILSGAMNARHAKRNRGSPSYADAKRSGKTASRHYDERFLQVFISDLDAPLLGTQVQHSTDHRAVVPHAHHKRQFKLIALLAIALRAGLQRLFFVHPQNGIGPATQAKWAQAAVAVPAWYRA